MANVIWYIPIGLFEDSWTRKEVKAETICERSFYHQRCGNTQIISGIGIIITLTGVVKYSAGYISAYL